MLVRTAYKCRAYPDQVQTSVLNRTFGCVLVAWNLTPANASLAAMKATEELAWLNEVSSVPLQQAIRHQHAAYPACSRL